MILELQRVSLHNKKYSYLKTKDVLEKKNSSPKMPCLIIKKRHLRLKEIISFPPQSSLVYFIRIICCLHNNSTVARSDLMGWFSIGQLSARQLVNQLKSITRVASFRVDTQARKKASRLFNVKPELPRPTWRARAPVRLSPQFPALDHQIRQDSW